MTTDPYTATPSEMGLVATIIEVPEAYYDATAAGITADSFTNRLCRDVFEAMDGLIKSGKPITRLGILTALGDTHGTSPLKPFVDAGGNSRAFIASFAADIKRGQMARRLKAAGLATVEKCERGDDPQKILAETQTALAESGAETIRVRSLADIRRDKIAEWQAASGKGFIDMPTLWPELDAMLGGHRRKMVNVLGGYRGEGKSTLARQMATAVAMNGIPVGIISMEDPDGIVGAGIAGNLGNFSVYHMDTGDAKETVEEVSKRWEAIEKLPITVIDQPMNIGQLINAMRLLVARFGVQFILIDHIQYILPSGRHTSRNEEVMRYSSAICAATKDLGVHTLVLSQLSRDSEKEERKPKLSDLRDSGAIEQDARAVMLLYRDAQDGKHRLAVAKNNNGPKGVLKIERIDGRQRFEMIGKE